MINISKNNLQFVWGCDPCLQLELGWIFSLLKPARQVSLFHNEHFNSNRLHNVLIESGLPRLQRSLSLEMVAELKNQRIQRLHTLAKTGSFGIIHLSDEEGLDGDDLYPLLPEGTVVWRNFAYPRFKHFNECRIFPIGPRLEFIDSSLSLLSAVPASKRFFPWGFMGTLWSTGSRFLATSMFLRSLPQGFFHGSRGFSQGLPLAVYQQQLLRCSFALCPEGDRHLDTFRLYESLESGCIPLLVDQRQMANSIIGFNSPIPVFRQWHDALDWAQYLISKPQYMDKIQSSIQFWWQQKRLHLANTMLHTFTREVF